eukprot:scaffold16594_cov124-Isochrysis_galbana.AAC.7
MVRVKNPTSRFASAGPEPRRSPRRRWLAGGESGIAQPRPPAGESCSGPEAEAGREGGSDGREGQAMYGRRNRAVAVARCTNFWHASRRHAPRPTARPTCPGDLAACQQSRRRHTTCLG